MSELYSYDETVVGIPYVSKQFCDTLCDKVHGTIEFESFCAKHKMNTGIDGIISSIQEVNWFKDHLTIKMDFATSKNAVARDHMLYISYKDIDGSFAAHIGCNKNIIRSYFNCRNTNNCRLVFRGSSISAETFIIAAAIWWMHPENIRDTFADMCADVLDGSGSKKSRSRYGLSFNIHPDNLELVTKGENSSRSSHKK